MTVAKELKRLEASRRRMEREEKRRQREIERILKENARLSALEQARLEVEQYENSLVLLLSMHKEVSSPVDWLGFVSAVPPHIPPKFVRHETNAQFDEIAGMMGVEEAEARSRDEREYLELLNSYRVEESEWKSLRGLAEKVLAGDMEAYLEAISRFSAFGEIDFLGSSVEVRAINPKAIECKLSCGGVEVLPKEAKTLSASGKVLTKAIPKGRLNEVYQDYVCGSALRVAREVFSLLPVEMVVVTAYSDSVPILSVALPKEKFESLDFKNLDPSDSLEGFLHHGEIERERKSGEFVRIKPLTSKDLFKSELKEKSLESLISEVRILRRELALPEKVSENRSEPTLSYL